MSASLDVIHPQDVAEIGQGWKVVPLVRKDSGKGSSCSRLISGDASSSDDECNTKVRKPYTITKQRERWTESEHQKFLEALKLYGRAWRRIEEYIGTKTAVQIRSHAQKFFSKLEREASTGSSAGKVHDIEIPPPRPKRKPSHPYPKKAGNSPLNVDDESKELSALSAADCSEVHHKGSQSGSFNPYINKGSGASTAAFQRNPFVPGHFFGPQGSVKLFGRTVVVPKNHKPAAHNDSTKECISDGKSLVSNPQANKADLPQASGFYPFLKGRESANFSEQPLVSDRSGSCIVINPSERPGELHSSNCSDRLPTTYESGAVNSHCFSEGEDQQQGGRVELRNIEHPCPLPQKDGVNLNVLFPHGIQQNQPVHHWINNFFGYHSGLALPPMAGHGPIDGVPNNPLTYWQFMQASAVNYAAYTAAVAAAAAAGWSGSISGHEEAAETSQANVNEAKVLPSLGNDLSPTALPSAATSWWPHRGLMRLGYSLPMGAVQQEEQVDTDANIHPYENEDLDFENVFSRAEHAMDLGIADEAETSNFEEDDKKQEAEKSHPANSDCMMGTLCPREAPVPESALPGSECQHDIDATIMPAKCSTQQSDTERRASIESPENLYTSSDEFDGQVKKQREGSSSGSNTPISRFQSSECETLGMLESKKRDSYTLFEDNDDTCSDAFKKSHQLFGNATTEAPKVIAKHSDKGRKHQQKECRHGGSDDSKRLKSCAHELELRKEVSEEGRKAFRALFTSKLLPQTFAAVNMVEGGNAYSRNEHVSRPTVSRKESDPACVPVPMDIASGEYINPDRSPQGDAIGEVHAHGKFSTTNSRTNLDMGFGCVFMKEQHEGNGKRFAVSPSSGFVPYKRPVCTEARIPEHPLHSRVV